MVELLDADVLLEITPSGPDIRLENGDLAPERGLVSALLVSLFTDARAPADAELPDGSDDRRGWWASEPDDPHGSLLWLLERAKLTQGTLLELEEYSRNALAWLLREGIAERVDSTAERLDADTLQVEVTVERGASSRWSALWDGTAAQALDVPGLTVRVLVR